MKSKITLVIVLVLVLLTAVSAYWYLRVRDQGLSQDPDNRYNVVVIVSDALRQDVLGCYGGVAKTPYIDWLQQNGVLFENSYSTSPWTSPSSVSMFTGNYATSYGYAREGQTQKRGDPQAPTEFYVPQIYVPENELLFAEAVKLLGYNTGMQIENINASMHNNLQGFTSVRQYTPSDDVARTIAKISRGGVYDSLEGSTAYAFSVLVMLHLLDLEPEENFFTLYWMLDPHAPYTPVEKFASKIQVDESKLAHPKDFYRSHVYDKSKCTEPEAKYVFNLYVAEVESVDERVGFILRTLRHEELLENTFVVFTSDHGEQFGEHGLWEHGGHGKGCHYYETLLRVPLIIAGPGLPKGRIVKTPVSLIGLMPTLKELLGVKYDDKMKGESFVPLMLGEGDESEFLYFDDIQDHDQVDAVLKDDYKLISLKDSGFELYDVVGDPRESINYAPQSAQRVDAMYDIISRMREENEKKQKKNLAALGDDLPMMSEEKKRKVVEKLKSLGYID